MLVYNDNVPLCTIKDPKRRMKNEKVNRYAAGS